MKPSVVQFYLLASTTLAIVSLLTPILVEQHVEAWYLQWLDFFTDHGGNRRLLEQADAPLRESLIKFGTSWLILFNSIGLFGAWTFLSRNSSIEQDGLGVGLAVPLLALLVTAAFRVVFGITIFFPLSFPVCLFEAYICLLCIARRQWKTVGWLMAHMTLLGVFFGWWFLRTLTIID